MLPTSDDFPNPYITEVIHSHNQKHISKSQRRRRGEARSMAAVLLESASTGVINSVMEKLAALMGEQYEQHKAVRRDVAFLRDELGSMNAVLKKLADMEELDPQTMEWRNQVMGTAFDIEDSIDDFTHQVGGSVSAGDAGFVAKIRQYVNELRVRHRFTKQIQELKSRVIEVSERRKRYRVDDGGSSTSSCVAIDPRMTALYAEAANLVGIDGPMGEIIRLLNNGGDEPGRRCLRVVAIVGFGGLGKTTVANEVYRKLGGQYNFKAFVSVSQRPDLMKLLSRIVYKVGMPQLNHTNEVEDLIENVREFLKDKRYLFVIDDIWDASVWEILRCAFPDNEKGSKVIATTRIETVAKACCTYRREFIYRMKPLDDQNSAKLFYSRVGYVCAQPLTEIANETLQKCGGLPLAIISIASLLASQPARSREQWKFVCSSLSSNLRTNPTLEGMRQVLKLSYDNLPPHLKTCLLYIGVYPEDHSIEKEDLVRLWVAEGFVRKLHDQGAEEVAGSYFNELVNRSMIEPTYIDYNGEVWRCKVHDMMLDLIRMKSEEESFLRVVDNVHDISTSLQARARRLSLHLDFRADQETKAAASLSVSHIRSFTLFGNTYFMPPLSEFKFIRVLNLKDWSSDGEDTIDLTPIAKLYQLRYLNVRREARLPAQIRTLERLETLDMDKLDGDVPSDIVHLRCLLHLLVPYGKSLPDGICAMKSMHTLRHFDLAMNSVDNFKGLGELTNLRDLRITCTGRVPQQGIRDTLWSSIGKLINCKLRALTFPPYGPVDLPPPATESDGSTISQAEGHLEILELSSTMFPQVPSWIGQHHKLSKLALSADMLKQDGVDLLAQLPNLYHLEMNIRKPLKERILVRGGSTAFPVLRYLQLSCSGRSGSTSMGAG
ncbi:disease resistance protein RPP13-like isoform X2 [Panicum hallii]|uniref:disease resistance protein RPP13-like isoform X2 n=1 Tax=Panicum hallii TaxID=206008 RepID=UPI000DF4CDBF|nr:disease resistance protein RPP13-like isoform X2 [Panicum hallii]